MIRVHTVARDAAVRFRTAAIDELKALVVTADDQLRAELRCLGTTRLTQRCARFRTAGLADLAVTHTRLAKDTHRRCRTPTRRQFGYVTAATFFLAWSHPGDCRSEAAFARLAGVAPIEATSGQNRHRHRLC